MIKIVRLQLDSRYNYFETKDVYLNPRNIERVETDDSDEDILHIGLVSGHVLTTNRKSLNKIVEKFY